MTATREIAELLNNMAVMCFLKHGKTSGSKSRAEIQPWRSNDLGRG
jgi:hypothetical protein